VVILAETGIRVFRADTYADIPEFGLPAAHRAKLKECSGPPFLLRAVRSFAIMAV
jgi:hypothetical protein